MQHSNFNLIKEEIEEDEIQNLAVRQWTKEDFLIKPSINCSNPWFSDEEDDNDTLVHKQQQEDEGNICQYDQQHTVDPFNYSKIHNSTQGNHNPQNSLKYDNTTSTRRYSTLSTSSSISSFHSRTMHDDDYIPQSSRESILIKKASMSSLKKKRRESTGDIFHAKRRPLSTPVLPRLTQSSVLQPSTLQYQSPPPSKSTKSNRRKHFSLQQPLSQHEKNKLAALDNDDNDDVKGVHWDPHIDAFEILRARITGITRSMQEFHVQELFQDELMAEERRKRLSVFPKSTYSTPLFYNNNKDLTNSRRYSLANLSQNTSTHFGHRRIKSQSVLPSITNIDFNPSQKETKHDSEHDHHDDDDDDDDKHSFHEFEKEKKFLHDFLNHEDVNFKPEEEEEEDLENTGLLTSPNLTTLFFTTNNLISSRLDELSETASIKSNQESDTNEQLEWQKNFLSLVNSCIHQSEALESLSTDLLNTEHRVRELMLVKDTINEQFQEREKQYEERIRECQEIAQQQLMMIDSLEELNADIDMKLETSRREMYRQEALKALNANTKDDLADQDNNNKRWDFRKSVADLLNMDEKHDVVQKMRWEIGMFVGGGVGTGHIIHTFEDKLNGIDMMIAGTGTTSTSPNDCLPYEDYSINTNEDDDYHQAKSMSISPSINHIRLYQHDYIIHLNNRDRQTRFSLLPRSLWVPDEEATQCQFQQRQKQCPTKFSFFQRRHHCRKCGLIICQRHSANRLPLFHPSKIYSTTGQWSRVCDTCFYDLIIQK